MPEMKLEVAVGRIIERVEHVVYLLEDQKEKINGLDHRIVALEEGGINNGEARLRRVEDFMGKIVAVAGFGAFLMGIIQFVINKYF